MKKLELDHIVKPLRPLAVPIDSLVMDDRNPMDHDRRNVLAVRASLERYGQRIPIVVQKKGMVVRSGNCRVTAAKELGWKHIAAVVIDDDPITSVAWAITDNRTPQLAAWSDNLAEAFEYLSDSGFEFDSSLFTKGEIEAFTDVPVEKIEAYSINEDEDDLELLGSKSKKSHICPKCGHTWKG